MARPYRDRSVANAWLLTCDPDRIPSPTDELHGAEDALEVLQHVLHTIAADDLSRPTPCAEIRRGAVDRTPA